MHLNSLDFTIIILYFVLVLIIGLIYTRRAGKSIEEYFVSGRSLPWWVIGTSMVATTFSTDTPNLVSNIVRTNGVSGNWVWWVYLITGMFTVFLYAKLWRRSGTLTDVGFYELRYSGKAAAFLRGFRAIYLGLFFNVIVMASVTLAAIKIGGVLLGLNKYVTVISCGVITVLYSSTAGLWGVVATDLLLFVIAMIGSITAAYYALSHPDVGGITGLLSHPYVGDKLHILPDFSKWETVIPIFIIPMAVQWWSTWYPGAEPGGGGFIAQRMLSAKDEKHSVLATLWFNIAHYAIRPWPWIIVALCSLIVFPDLDSIQDHFPNIQDYSIPIGHDLGYPAMLSFLPNGLLGLVVASLAAAYMSTISTSLNWGASYIIDDFYKRFVNPNGDDKHYVLMARIVTVIMMVLMVVLSLSLQNALQVFDILLQVGAGTGSIYLLRWFWWRVNAWSEITAMVVSFAIICFFQFMYPMFEGAPVLLTWHKLVIGVLITTVSWIAITFFTPSTDLEVLQKYYDTIQPIGFGWQKVVHVSAEVKGESFTASLLCIVMGCLAVYSVLFGTGYLLYGIFWMAVFLFVVGLVCSILIIQLLPKIGWR